jgi:hypothetical protein
VGKDVRGGVIHAAAVGAGRLRRAESRGYVDVEDVRMDVCAAG